MKYVILTLSVLVLAISSCKKVVLDGLAFPREKLDHYSYDAYPESELDIPDSYQIPAANRTLIPLTSTDAETGETYTIYGIYFGDIATIATDTIIYYLHGQSRHMDYYWTRACLLANVGEKLHYGVLMIDYRGYGMSEGEPTERGLYEDADAGINWLMVNGANPARTIYYGFSLGCIPAIDRAAYRTDFSPARLIIESPLASVENLAQSSLVLTIDSHFLTSLEFNNAEKIKDVKQPLLWLHGVEDDYIAISNGELIYGNYQGSYKAAERINGAGHAAIPLIMGYGNYLSRLEAFFTGAY